MEYSTANLREIRREMRRVLRIFSNNTRERISDYNRRLVRVRVCHYTRAYRYVSFANDRSKRFSYSSCVTPATKKFTLPSYLTYVPPLPTLFSQ